MQHVALLEGKNNPFTIVKGKGDKNIHSTDEDFHIIIYSRLGITTEGVLHTIAEIIYLKIRKKLTIKVHC